MSNEPKTEKDADDVDDEGEDDEDDDDPDEWDQRIIKTGCADENLKLQLCHADTNDWRQCMGELKAFRKCWEEHSNNERTQAKDNDMSKF